MIDFTLIKAVLQEICDCAVQALGRFSELTNFHPKAMHESFMASYAFDRLGGKISMAPELMVRTISDWNNPGVPLPAGVKPQQRVDLTLFEPQNVQKDDQNTWCLIEFKRLSGNVNADYEKVKSLLPVLDCPFGAACGVVEDTVSGVQSWLPKETLPGEHYVISKPWIGEIATKHGDGTITRGQSTFVMYSYLFANPHPPTG